MKFVHTHIRTSTNFAAITFLSIVAIVSFPSTILAGPKEKQLWRFQYTRTANAPINCPTEAYLRTSLAANLDGQVPFDKDAPRSIVVTIEQISNEVEARITIQDANGTETRPPLHAPFWRCDQLAERIVFALQNIVDPLNLPQAETVATPNTPESHSDDAPQNEPTPSIEKTPRKPQRSSMIPKLGLSLAIGPAWWNAPETALSTSVGFELLWQRATVAIEGHYDYAWAVPQLPNYMAERTTVMIMGCARHHWSTRFMIRGCGFGDFGKTLFDNKKNHSQTPYAPVADVGARIALGVWFTTRFGIEARADAAYAAARPEVRLLDNRLWQMHPFTGALRLAFLGVFDVF